MHQDKVLRGKGTAWKCGMHVFMKEVRYRSGQEFIHRNAFRNVWEGVRVKGAVHFY